jgi:hypothetical protein
MATPLSMREEKRNAGRSSVVAAVLLLARACPVSAGTAMAGTALACTVLACTVLACTLLACNGAPPPGAEPNVSPSAVTVSAAGASPAAPAATSASALPSSSGTSGNLPFEPTGEKLASVAWRAWVYTDPGPTRTRYGYLRAGAVVDRSSSPLLNEGCAEGWYRVNPRGYMCIGKGATLDLEHPVVRATRVRPQRGAGFPYPYALARQPSPFLYFRLPSAKDMLSAEGERYRSNSANWRAQAEQSGLLASLAPSTEVPDFLANSVELEKPYGVERRLHVGAHSGQSGSDSGFALLQVFDSEQRVWGVTTELDVIALDRTRVVRPSEFHGLALGKDQDLPVGSRSFLGFNAIADRRMESSSPMVVGQNAACWG